MAFAFVLCPDIVSAYSVDTGTTLCTEPCEEKSNEITAVPRLLERMDLEDKIVTADAMSCQKKIIDVINKKKGKFLMQALRSATTSPEVTG